MTGPAGSSASGNERAAVSGNEASATAVARSTLVAGGTGALGIAVLRRLLDDGHEVTTTWVEESEHDHVLAELPDSERLRLVRVDVTDPHAVDDLVTTVPRLDGLVNLVGGYSAGRRVHETEPSEFEAMFRLNLTPTFLLARAAMPRLVDGGGGGFVAVSSRAAVRPFAGAAGYITSKAALIALVQSLDAEYRDDGVRCNVVLPSTIDTPANRRAQPDADVSRWVTPAQVADVVAFLVSPLSAAVSGAAVPVYGRA
jgi:NAD(P)-dependent dehydrogenase (short-subunit alcohol dehydrogenase family)